MSFFVAQGIRKSFDGFKAVDGVDLNVERGERRAIIGPNGAGKTTFFSLLTGLLSLDAGSVRLDRHDLTNLPPNRIAGFGISRAFQVTSIFPRLTVRRNVQVALLASSGMTVKAWGKGWDQKAADADEILHEVGLTQSRDAAAGTLSHGDQRALELAIALALEPRLLVLDEPTAGMAPEETASTMELIRRIVAEREITLLFSEHDMEVVFGTADRVTVMNQGRVLAEGAPDEVRRDPRVQEVYLGTA